MQRLRHNACSAFHAIIADALYRCTTCSAATCIIVTLRSLPNVNPSSPPMIQVSVADTGPGMATDELQQAFLNYNKPCCSILSTRRWGDGVCWNGVLTVATTDAGEDELRHYQIRMHSKNGPEILQLPRTAKSSELLRFLIAIPRLPAVFWLTNSPSISNQWNGDYNFSRGHHPRIFEFCNISLREGMEVVLFGAHPRLFRSIPHEPNCFIRWTEHPLVTKKTSILKLKNVTIDFCLQSDDDLFGEHTKGLRICDGSSRALEGFSSLERLCIGTVEYLSCYRCGFHEGSIEDMHFRELVQVGKGQAGSPQTKWILDTCVVLIEEAMANEIFRCSDSQQSVVAYFEDGCYTPAPESVLQALTMVEWSKFGIAIKEIRTADWGAVVIQSEEPRRFSAMFIVLHIYHKSTIRQRAYLPGGRGMVKAAVEASLTDLKNRFPQLFLSDHARQMQQIASDVSECIASIITSSTNENFREECASIVGLPFSNLDEMETIISTKMFAFIQKSDGQPKRRPWLDEGSNFDGTTLQAIDENDEDDSFSDDDEPEFL